jgi:hypothetical protein
MSHDSHAHLGTQRDRRHGDRTTALVEPAIHAAPHIGSAERKPEP